MQQLTKNPQNSTTSPYEVNISASPEVLLIIEAINA